LEIKKGLRNLGSRRPFLKVIYFKCILKPRCPPTGIPAIWQLRRIVGAYAPVVVAVWSFASL
jgi:hypothetical protein